jgi:hypothetical protein
MTTPTKMVKIRNADAHVSRVQDNVSAVLDPVAQSVGSTPIMGAPPPAWVALSLLADFAQTTGQAVSAYHKDALGYVHSKGSVTTAAGQAAGVAVVGPLPLGCRPKEPQRLSVRGNAGAVQAIVIGIDGTLKLDVAVAAGGTVDLGFSFLAEQ